MEQLEELKNWLQSWPGWGGQMLGMDHIDLRPGCLGLFPQGLQIRKRQADLQGNVESLCRLSCKLQLCSDSRQQETVRKLLDFQAWVTEQQILGRAPIFGCAPHKEQLFAGEGKLLKQVQPGLWLYQMELWIEFVWYWEAKENDGSF